MEHDEELVYLRRKIEELNNELSRLRRACDALIEYAAEIGRCMGASDG